MMKKISSFGVLTFMLCITFQQEIKSQKLPTIAESPFIIWKDTSIHIAFPDLITLSDGSFFVTWRQGADHYRTGRLMKQFGYPDAKKWSNPEILYDDSLSDERDPSIELTPEGKIMLIFFKYIRGRKDTIPNVHHIFTCYSNDNGNSFGTPVQIDPGELFIKSAYIKDSLNWVDENNNVIMVNAVSSGSVFYRESCFIPSYGGTPMVSFDKKTIRSPASRITIFSRRNGESYWKSIPVNHELWKDVWMQEPSMIIINDSLWLMHIRTAKGTPYKAGNLAQTISSDGGKTWSEFQYLPFIAHSPFLFYTEDSILISAFRLLNEEYTLASTAFIVSENHGKTWSEPILIEGWSENECGYPSITKMKDGRLLMVYYGDNGTAIKGVILK